MSAPNTNTKILPFNQRVQAVAVEVSKRIATAPTKQREAVKARLWCNWLAKEVL